MNKLLLLSFPYKTDAEGNTFPVVPLSLKFGHKKKEFFALVDSGATISIFRSEVADSLGINVNSGKEIYLGGVGGRIKGYIHKLEVEIAGKQFVCPVVFSYEYLVSFNLLGRDVFFEQFRIIFEEKKNNLILE
ncbi:MAG: retroviral-like aspartic protease family protein [Patescibacteria group bacterium]